MLLATELHFVEHLFCHGLTGGNIEPQMSHSFTLEF